MSLSRNRVRFNDKTAFHLQLDVLMEIKTVEARDWKDGDGKLVKTLQ